MTGQGLVKQPAHSVRRDLLSLYARRKIGTRHRRPRLRSSSKKGNDVMTLRRLSPQVEIRRNQKAGSLVNSSPVT